MPGVPIQTGKLSKLLVHPSSASEFIPEIEWSDMPRRMAHAFAIENSKEDGGSLTPRSHIGQINEPYVYGPRLSSKQGERLALFSGRGPLFPSSQEPLKLRTSRCLISSPFGHRTLFAFPVLRRSFVTILRPARSKLIYGLKGLETCSG